MNDIPQIDGIFLSLSLTLTLCLSLSYSLSFFLYTDLRLIYAASARLTFKRLKIIYYWVNTGSALKFPTNQLF